MQKSKLGVSIGLVGAALYFFGAFNTLPAILLAGYVLLFEENDWLKKSAIKMVTVLVVFNVLIVAVGLIQDVFSVVNIFVNWFKYVNITMPLNLDNLLIVVLSFLEKVLLIFMGISALSMGTVKIKFVDNVINKHF